MMSYVDIIDELATLRAQLAEMRAELLREHEDHAQTVIDAADVLRELREVTAQRDALLAVEYPDAGELAAWRAMADELLADALPPPAAVRRAAHLLQNAYRFAAAIDAARSKT